MKSSFYAHRSVVRNSVHVRLVPQHSSVSVYYFPPPGPFHLSDLRSRLVLRSPTPIRSSFSVQLLCTVPSAIRFSAVRRAAVHARQALQLAQPACQLQYRAQALVAEASELRRSGTREAVSCRGEEAEFGLGQAEQLLIEEVRRRDLEEAGERCQVVDRGVVPGASTQLPEVGRGERSSIQRGNSRRHLSVRVFAASRAAMGAEEAVDPPRESARHEVHFLAPGMGWARLTLMVLAIVSSVLILFASANRYRNTFAMVDRLCGHGYHLGRAA